MTQRFGNNQPPSDQNSDMLYEVKLMSDDHSLAKNPRLEMPATKGEEQILLLMAFNYNLTSLTCSAIIREYSSCNRWE